MLHTFVADDNICKQIPMRDPFSSRILKNLFFDLIVQQQQHKMFSRKQILKCLTFFEHSLFSNW